ncbi:MAG TPA: sterol desaturase family protein [Tepidisphaeraceae bacterium]|nr:sterol desaturase family protein [Tepidisphaeraceae bacterium]
MSILEREDQLQPACAAQALFPEQTAQTTTEASPVEIAQPRGLFIIAAGLIVLGSICLAVRYLYPFDFISDSSHGWFLDRLIPRAKTLVSGWSLEMMIAFPFGLLGVFLLERFFPAVPAQKTVTTGLVNDALWILVRAVAQIILFAAYSRILYRLYVQYLSGFSIPLAELLPIPVSLVLAVLVADLAQWLQHWLHHKVKWLWMFHAVHHSQRELNVFSDYRGHFMEYVVRRPVVLMPLLMLGLEEPQMTWWILLITWQTRLNHANVRFNFGPLRYIFVTPQSHRVHHSLQAEHIDHNYGSIFSIWDYLFGTQVRNYDVYPETGIDDEAFPVESSKSVKGVLITIVRQIAYPFRQVWLTLWPGRS